MNNLSYLMQASDPTAALARGEVERQLKELEKVYTELISLIGKHYQKSQQENRHIFVTQMFLGGSYEIIKSFLGKSYVKQLRMNNQTFEFFYHCRNACFHGNRFNFEYIQPANATWNTHTIVVSDEGKALFPIKLPMNEVLSLIKDVSKIF